MSDYEDEEIIDSHEGEHPEIVRDRSRDRYGPMIACDNSGSPASELNQERELPKHKLNPYETVVYEEEYIPPVDRD